MSGQREERANETADREAAPTARWLARYTIGAAIVWAGVLVAVAVVLRGSDYFAQLLPILSGAMVWFVVISPAALARTARPDRGDGRRMPGG